MKKLLFYLNLLFFTLNLCAQKSNKISVTNERKYTINGESIVENDTVKISKSKLLKKNCDTTKTYFVIYDFKTGKYEEALFKPKVDKPIVFKIKNINRLAFNVQVNTNDEVIAQTDWFTSTEDLKKITGLLSETNIVSQAKAEDNITTPDIKPSTEKVKNNSSESQIKDINTIDKLNLELQQYRDELNKLNSEKEIFVNYKTTFNEDLAEKNIQKPSDSIIDGLLEKIKNSVNEVNKIEKIQNDKLAEFQLAKENFNNSYKEFSDSYKKVSSIIQNAKNVLPVANQPFLSLKEYTDIHQINFRIILLNLLAMDVSVNIINNQYINLVVSYNKLKNIDKLENYYDKVSLKKYFDDVDLVFDNAKKIKFKEELIEFEKIANQVKRIINLLEKEETFEYISKPIQPQNDIATFDVEISSKNKEVEVDNSRKFKHKEFVRRGTRIDFSIGLAGSYFDNSPTYEIYTENGNNKIGLKNNNLTVPSLITMISMTSRSSKYVALGGSAGLGIDITNGKIQMSNFFIGPTLVLGKYDRLMFTPGVALRNVGKLKNGFAADATILDQTSDVNSVLTDNYKIGFFVALTYNLTKNVRDKISNYK